MNGANAAISRLDPAADHVAVRRWRVRGFTLPELLVVVAIIGLITVVALGQIMKTTQRAKLDNTVSSLRLLIQRASIEMQRRSVVTFVRIGPAAGGVLRVKLIADTNGPGGIPDGRLSDPTDGGADPDTLVDSVDIPLGVDQQIALSSHDASEIESTRWEWQDAAPDWSDAKTDVTHGRLLMCDFRSRAIRPDTGLQLDQRATLRLTHFRMFGGYLQPPVRYELQISPVWNVTIVRQVGNSSGVWVTSEGQV